MVDIIHHKLMILRLKKKIDSLAKCNRVMEAFTKKGGEFLVADHGNKYAGKASLEYK